MLTHLRYVNNDKQEDEREVGPERWVPADDLEEEGIVHPVLMKYSS